MHAYLIVGSNKGLVEERLGKLFRRLKAKRLEYPLTKIKEVRELESFTKLAVDAPTAVEIRDIDTASTEALNAFLKNLEEPQENLFYILTATSVHNLPGTIVSRCQIIKVGGKKELKSKTKKEIISFAKKNKVGQLRQTSRIWNRQDAVSFIENYILVLHGLLIDSADGHSSLAKNIKRAGQTLNNLKTNGNVQLQLTNFVLGLV